MVGAIIAAVTAIASAVQQSEAASEAAKQTRYDSEFEAEQARMQAEQERLNREQARKAESRYAEEAKQQRLAMLTRAGGGIGVSALQELSRQASIDEINIQNADLASIQKRKALGLSSSNALLQGRVRAGAYKSKGRASLVSGFGSAAGSIAQGMSK